MKASAYEMNQRVPGKRTMKKAASVMTAAMLLASTFTLPTLAETTATPPAPPEGAQMQQG